MCGSKILRHQLRDFHEYVKQMRRRSLSDSERGMEAVEEHKRIMEALQNRDADRAEAQAALHMQNAYDNMVKNGVSDARAEKERTNG